MSKRKKRQRREAKQIMKIIERLNVPVVPWGTTERYFKQIEEEAITLADEIWDRGNSLSYSGDVP